MLLWVSLLAAVCLGLLFRFPYFAQDVRYVLCKLRFRRRLLKYVQNNYTVLDRFLDAAKTQPHKPLVLFGDETFTYQDADELSNKAARAFLQDGRVRAGDTVALFLSNEPPFLWLWLGLVKLGCPVAFLNYNIRSASLLHCFGCSGATALVAGADLQGAVEEILPSLLEQQVAVFTLAGTGDTPGVESFADKMSAASSDPLPGELRSHVTAQSPVVYIYTSGTTGVPKAAVVIHSRLWSMSWLHELAGVSSTDVTYISLPLYHSSAFVGFTGAINMGGTVALARKFSASRFWDDCRRHDATVILYIGETMRYLCSKPKKLGDKNHAVRLAVGNGMRADVWREFLAQFGNIRVREFYGATEGNFSLINYSDRIGAIGRHVFLNRMISPYGLIKYDTDKGEPIRDSSGLCVEAAKGEPGLLVAEMSRSAPFSGYLGDLAQTEKKKLHSVFRHGDTCINSGDLLRVDGEDFVYFHDRVGDSFRWKGENVATAEVADVITLASCVKEATVYGVKVPGQEGSAGMAAVALREGQRFDSADVFRHVEKHLPNYARPRFLRIQSSLDLTGTFKHKKGTLMEEGFNPDQITDPLYFLNQTEKNYVPLSSEIFDFITSGGIQI